MLSGTAQVQFEFVENGSFEKFDECFKHYGQIEAALAWEQLLGSSSDYFNSECSHGETIAGVPDNYVGHQYANSGNGYAGFYLFNANFTSSNRKDFMYREHIRTKLIRPLKRNVKYDVRAFVSLAESSSFITNQFSFCFSNQENMHLEQSSSILSCERKLTVSLSGEFNHDNENWVEISGTYMAYGGEQYLTIGLFYEDVDFRKYRKIIKKHVVESPPKKLNQKTRYCYYYIDDVSVKPAIIKN